MVSGRFTLFLDRFSSFFTLASTINPGNRDCTYEKRTFEGNWQIDFSSEVERNIKEISSQMCRNPKKLASLNPPF